MVLQNFYAGSSYPRAPCGQKSSFDPEKTASSKLVNVSNRLQWCFVCGLNPASKLTKPVTANEDANRLTSDGHNLDTAGNITSTATRRDLRKSQQKQQNIVSSHNWLFACNAQHDMTSERRHSPQDVIFHSDSFPVQIDSGASQSISNDKSHFKSIESLDTNDPAGILGLTEEKSPKVIMMLLTKWLMQLAQGGGGGNYVRHDWHAGEAIYDHT